MLRGVLGTRVDIPVVLRHQIDVVKDEAAERALLAGLRVADVHECRPVERALSRLLDDEDAIVELLPLQDWVHVAEEQLEVLLTVSATQCGL